MSLRRVLATCALATVTIGVLGVASATAAPAPVFTPSPYTGPIRGDVTGDGVADSVVLGEFGTYPDRRCAARLTAGVGRGVSAPPVFVDLPLRGEVFECPDLGTFVAGPSPAANRLAVGFFAASPNGGERVQVFSLTGGTATYRMGTSDSQFQPSRLGSEDFDGDGWGDLWESTDQIANFTAFLVHGSTVRPLTTVYSGGFPQVQFADLNHGRGTDILLGTSDGARAAPAAAVVVDGLTGATQQLASGDLPGGVSVDEYRLAVVDLDHDTYADLRVDAVTRDQVVATTYWRNRSQGGRWSFAPATAPVV